MGSLSLLNGDHGWAVHLMLETMTPIVRGLKSTKVHKEPRHILSLKGWFGYWLMYRPLWLGTPLIRRKIAYLFVCLNNSLSPTQHPKQSMFAKANAAAAFGSTLHRGGQRRIWTNQLQLGGNSSSSWGKPAPRLAWLALTDTDSNSFRGRMLGAQFGYFLPRLQTDCRFSSCLLRRWERMLKNSPDWIFLWLWDTWKISEKYYWIKQPSGAYCQ